MDLVTLTGLATAGALLTTQIAFAMTRIDFTPALPTLETEAAATLPARKPEESEAKEGFAEVFAGVQMPGGHTPTAKQGQSNGGGAPAMVSLRRVEVSPSMRLIMPAAPVPDATSLHAFARMQGLDENAIAQLFGQDDAITAPNLENLNSKVDTNPADAMLDPAAAILAAPVLVGLGSVEPSAWMASAQTADPDATLAPAGNMLSIGMQRFLLPTRAQTVEVAVNAPVAQDAGAEVEIIPLELSLPDAPNDTLDAPATTQLVPPADIAPRELGARWSTWDALGAIAATHPGAAAPTAALSKALQGQSMTAADLALLSPASMEEVVAQSDAAVAGEATDSGGPGNPGSGWTSAHQAASAQTVTVGDVMETGDVFISRQLGEQLAQRMGEQIAQRVMNKLAQGEWQFKFVINPKNLGEIQVNLRMHAGGLDGAFIANQSSTREMLGESMNRLRDVLNGLGMNVASLDVGADHSSRQGRQSMASGQTAPALEPQGLPQSANETIAARRTDLRGGDQGWDVLV